MAPSWTAARTQAARRQAAHGCRPNRERRHDLLAAHRRAVPACQRHLRAGPSPGDPVMTAAALKRELASIRGALASLTPAAPQALGDPVAWAERIAGLSLDPWQRDVLLSAAPRLLLLPGAETKAPKRSDKPRSMAGRSPGKHTASPPE